MIPTNYIVAFVIMAAVIATAAFFAARGWNKRSTQQASKLVQPSQTLSGTQLSSERFTDLYYVATTYTDDPLNRVSAFGLGARGKAELHITKDGILIERQGETSLALSQHAIVKVTTTQATIDRGVEKDGLIQIEWLSQQLESKPDVSLSTFIRVVSTDARKDLLNKLEALIKKEAVK